MKLSTQSVFDQFIEASTEVDYEKVRNQLKQGGYSLFHDLLDRIKKILMVCEEDGLEQMKQLIHKGKAILPQPVQISPSWEKVWEEHDRMIFHKAEILANFPQEERNGEWQIVMDNPFTNEGVVCYPGLSFIEATYLFAYFRKDLKKNENIRMQKIMNLFFTEGS